MLSFCRTPFFIALGLACCVFFCVQSQPTTLERRETITRRLNGHVYTLERLASHEQGANSETFRVVGGFEGVAAIVKIIDQDSRIVSDRAKEEVKFLRKRAVRQLLHYQKEKKRSHIYAWTLVLRDIHEDYPQPGDQLAPLYDILDENPDIDVAAAVRHVRTLAIRHSEALAESSDFVYRDIQPLNVFTNRELTEVQFIDYGPPGVMDVSSGLFSSSGQAQIRRANALAHMRQNAENRYTVEYMRRYMGQRSRRRSSHGGRASSSNA